MEATARQQAANEKREVESKIAKLVDTAARTTSVTLLRSLEERIEELSQKRDLLAARLAEPLTHNDVPDIGTLLERTRALLQNPLQVFLSGDDRSRQIIARLVFPASVASRRGALVGTPEFALCYPFFHSLTEEDKDLVDQSRESWNTFRDELTKWAVTLDGIETNHFNSADQDE